MGSVEPKGRSVSRREFVRAVGVGAGALALGAPLASAARRPPDEPIRVGVIGCGGRSGAHLATLQALKQQGHNVGITAVCDVYRPRLQAAAERTGGKPYGDYRELLADPNVDAVCLATPDRHHAQEAIDAVRAGKDVYCEKPVGHWSQFGLVKQLAKEVASAGAILQTGTQWMADSVWHQAADLVKQGAIGRPIHVQWGYFRLGDWGERMGIPDPEARPGPDLNWRAFLGEAPKRPFTVSRFFQWRLYWDYSGGPATDLFPHAFTPIHMILGVKFPTSVSAAGGKLRYDGLREVPDTFNMLIDYPEGVTVALLCTLGNAEPVPFAIRGTDATLTFGGPGIVLRPADGSATSKEVARTKGGDLPEHWLNFLECIRTRARPYADMERGYQVQTAMNMGILAFREKRVVRFDSGREEIMG